MKWLFVLADLLIDSILIICSVCKIYVEILKLWVALHRGIFPFVLQELCNRVMCYLFWLHPPFTCLFPEWWGMHNWVVISSCKDMPSCWFHGEVNVVFVWILAISVLHSCMWQSVSMNYDVKCSLKDFSVVKPVLWIIFFRFWKRTWSLLSCFWVVVKIMIWMWLNYDVHLLWQAVV